MFNINYKYLKITILKNGHGNWMIGIKFFKFTSIIRTIKLPRFISRNLRRLSFIIYYIKTFFKYSFNTFPIYVIRTEYDYVDHASSSYPQKFNSGFSFWCYYHKSELLEYFRPRDIDCGYNLYLDFISRDEYLNSQCTSRDYALEAFENGHPSTIRNGGY